MLIFRRCRWMVSVLLAIGICVASANAAAGLQLLRMTPQGDDVPPGRQVVFQFDRPVVPVGRMERGAEEVPIRIQPALACAWQWLNTTTLACQLDEQGAMVPATRYTVTIAPGLTALDGKALAQSIIRSFVTQRPAIQHTWFHHWRAPGVPEIELRFDQPVVGDSVDRHLAMVLPNGKSVAVQARPSSPSNGDNWIVSPVAALPLDTHIRLRIVPGIVSVRGPEPSAASRVIVSFDTFPAFKFLGLRCASIKDDNVTIAPAAPLSVQRKCNPMRPIHLRFSAPVTKEAVKDILNIVPSPTGGRQDIDLWANIWTSSSLSRAHRRDRVYTVRLPGPLKAFTTYGLHTLGKPIVDVFNRPLPTGIHLRFAVDHRPPNYRLVHQVSVLEEQVATHVPLYVTNLDSVHLQYKTMTAAGRQPEQQHDITVEKVEDISYAMPLKMRELIPASSGALQGHLTTTP